MIAADRGSPVRRPSPLIARRAPTIKSATLPTAASEPQHAGPVAEGARKKHNGRPVRVIEARRVNMAAGHHERSGVMKSKHAVYVGVAVVSVAMIWAGPAERLGAQQPSSAAVAIDADDIGG